MLLDLSFVFDNIALVAVLAGFAIVAGRRVLTRDGGTISDTVPAEEPA